MTTSINFVALEHKATVHAIGIMPDHVHVVISVSPSIAPFKIVQAMKGRSSLHINLLPSPELGEFRWQPEYGIVTFGESSLPRIISYLQNQRTHHAEQTIRPYLERQIDPDFDHPPHP